jgi:hypothetical protein
MKKQKTEISEIYERSGDVGIVIHTHTGYT